MRSSYSRVKACSFSNVKNLIRTVILCTKYVNFIPNLIELVCILWHLDSFGGVAKWSDTLIVCLTLFCIQSHSNTAKEVGISAIRHWENMQRLWKLSLHTLLEVVVYSSSWVKCDEAKLDKRGIGKTQHKHQRKKFGKAMVIEALLKLKHLMELIERFHLLNCSWWMYWSR